MTPREREIDRLYDVLARSSCPPEGPVVLRDCQPPAESGIYCFFESGEVRKDGQPRIVRVGESTDLRSRLLRQHLNGTHRDNRWEGGRLRSSRFRRYVGEALIKRDNLICPTWMDRSDPSKSEQRAEERRVEERVTSVISVMPVAWIAITGRRKERRRLERGIIGLLSNWGREAVDPPSGRWLGRLHDWPIIVKSGLWNDEHADASWTAGLGCAEKLQALR